MRKKISCILAFVLSLSLLPIHVSPESADAAPAFAKGADISWVPGMEAQGYVWRDRYGRERDIVRILRDDYQINSVRIRVFVHPNNDYGNGYMNAERAADLAKRASDLGLSVMLTLHYSDSWADPGKQVKPAAWEHYSFQELMDEVWNYTRQVMFTMRDRGVTPDWVQIGNETNNGMLWEDGRASTNMRNYAWLINTGHQAVKLVSPSTKTVVHLANGYDNELFRWNIGGLIDNGANFDVIAVSLYPSHENWQAINEQALVNMKDMIDRYGKEIVVSEVGMDYDRETEAKQFIADIIGKTRSLPGGRGLGVFYWEPQAYPGYNGGYNKGAWKRDGTPTAAMDGFIE